MYDYAVISEIGRRPYMEDAVCLKIADQGKVLFCGIYDGHSGEMAAQYARDNLHKFFFKALSAGSSQPTAFVKAFDQTSNNLRHQDSGTTALAFYIRGNAVAWANAGDSRLVVISGFKVKQLTEDHGLANPKEYRRVLKTDATIEPPYVFKDGYGLMPTRALGDEYFKDVGIIARPQTGKYQLGGPGRLAGGWH